MALPMILGLLGSGLAGAGVLGTAGLLASPLIAGSLGAGIGSAVETGDLREGIKTGLLSGLMGGIGGALVGGGSGVLTNQAAQQAAQQAGTATGTAGAQAASQGIRGMVQNMPTGFQPGPALGANATFGQAVRQGLDQGVLTGAGIGAAIPGTMQAMQPRPFDVPERRDIPEAEPFRREQRRPGPNYRPGFDPEFMYFSPSNYGATGMAAGGTVEYRSPAFSKPLMMQAGGLADIGVAMQGQAEPQMNEKDIVKQAVSAIRGEIPEEQAAIVLGMFLQEFGEEALRRLVSDVQTGKANGQRGDIEGMVEGPGDGMDDLVPAGMDDGSQDVLLSDGEFVVPADVVSGLGNGSTDAGAEELYSMMDRVREARTGQTEQPAQVKTGGLMPA